MHPIIKEIESSHLKSDIPYFRSGDTVRISVRIVEGDKERLQDYEGVVIARSGSGVRETFTVRRVSFGVGMERVFQLHSPRIDSIKVVRRGKVRRAKLYYLRNLRGKKARLSERRIDEAKLNREAESESKARLAQAEQGQAAQAVIDEKLAANEAPAETPQENEEAANNEESKS